jgi:hypothetical protein
MSDETPKGVTAIFVVDGRVLAHATDFHRSAPGGYTLKEAQESRAKMRLGFEVMKALASPTLYSGLDQYDCERIMNKIEGGKVQVLPIGYAEGER